MLFPYMMFIIIIIIIIIVFVCCAATVIGHILMTRHVVKQEMNKIAGLTIVFTVRVIYSLKTIAFRAVTPCNVVYFYGHFIEIC